MIRRQKKSDHAVPLWFVTFADMMALLLSFFILLQIFSELKKEDGEYRRTITAIRQAFGEDDGMGLMLLEQNSIRAVTREMEELVLREGRERHSSQAPTESLDGVHMRVRMIREGLAFTVGGPTAFAEGSAELSPVVREEIKKLAVLLAGRTNKIIVRGHAAAKYLPPSSPYRDLDDLSYARARNVKTALVELGLDDGVFRMEPLGNREPVRQRAYTTAAAAENRRVEVILTEELVEESDTDPRLAGPDLARRGSTDG